MNNFLDQQAGGSVFEDLPETTQYLTFELSGYVFGIPSQDILKIVMTPPPSQGGLVDMGLIQLGQYSIQLIDLPKILSLDSTGSRPSASSSRSLEKRKRLSSNLETDRNPPFLMVFQDARKALWGITLLAPPDMIEVPDYALKPVPAQRRTTRSLRWVSHIVNYDLERDRHSLLILDLSPILDPQSDSQSVEQRFRQSSISGSQGDWDGASSSQANDAQTIDVRSSSGLSSLSNKSAASIRDLDR